MSAERIIDSRVLCPACQTEWGPGLLACPGCGRLVHADQLKQISANAEAARDAGDLPQALSHWRQALTLLPANSRQYAVISNRIAEFSARVDAAQSQSAPASAFGNATSTAARQNSANRYGWAGGLVFLVTFLLTKAKLLLLGLTKASTLLTMAASLGVYWAEFGWKFAAGLVVSIYIHEMGHVAALRRYGIPASAPMFIPGLGAIVRLKQAHLSPVEDARTGLAGPIYGTCAAVGAYAVGLYMHWPAWLAIAHVGAWINLFNLLPIWQLDGSRGLSALDRPARILLLITVAVAWHYTNEGMLVLILMLLALRTFAGAAPPQRDRTSTLQFIALIVILSALTFYSATPRWPAPH